MTAQRRVAPARVLAALEVLGWPDDREASCDGGFTPRGEYWELAEDVIRAADEAADVPEWLREILHVVQGLAEREHEKFVLTPAHAQEALANVPEEVRRAAEIDQGVEQQ